MDLQRRNLHADRDVHVERTLIAAVLGLFLCAPAFAQVATKLETPPSPISVEVSPLRMELTAGPGSTTTQAVTITNTSGDAVRVRARLTDWDLSRDGSPQYESAEVSGRFSATAWVRVAPPETIIEPTKQAIVRISLAVPTSVQPGGYRTGVLFEFAPASGEPVARARSVMFKTRIATLVYVNIGQPPMTAELIDLRQRTVGAPGQQMLQVVASLKNTGRRYVRTKGTLVVHDSGDKVVRELPVPDAPLLPESERELAIAVVDPAKKIALPPGEYRVEIKLDLGMPALVVGETTIKVPR